MTGLSPGYVIPKIAKLASCAPGCNREVLAGPGAHAGTGHGSGSDSHSRVRAEYSLIYKARCVFCKNFHKPTSYCFRLNSRVVDAMARGKHHRHGSSSDSSEEDGERRTSSIHQMTLTPMLPVVLGWLLLCLLSQEGRMPLAHHSTLT